MTRSHTNSPTTIKLIEQYRDRWSSFGTGTGVLAVSEKLTPGQLKRYNVFRCYPDSFLEEISPDISVSRWKRNAILFEEGSYIDRAFIILHGNIEVYISKGLMKDPRKQPIFDSRRTRTSASKTRETSWPVRRFGDLFKRFRRKKSEPDIVFLSVMDFNLPFEKSLILKPGDIFGEIGALSGWPQSVTARTASKCTLLQIRVPALRKMKRKSGELKSYLDEVYKERHLTTHLGQTPLFRKCDDASLDLLAKNVELISCDPEEVITSEGKPADALYLVRSGFVKLTQQVGEGEMAVSYLSKGMTFGEVELLLKGAGDWLFTATSVAYAELLRIPKRDFQAFLARYPTISQHLWNSAVSRIKEAGYYKKNIRQSHFIETALEKGLVQGNSILVIDLNECTRCDDCVRGCADTHDGVPRFVREGEKYENLLITRACYHCRDPVCLIGCPTGAILRANVNGVVTIDDRLCIGCKACATACPYDAIIMYDTGEIWPNDMMPAPLRGKPQFLASKCDLCHTSVTGPACVNQCPRGCAIRVSSIEEFQELMN